MSTAIIGERTPRREDARLITGRATYTDDVQLPGMLYAMILRSPVAHARLSHLDVSAARALPGVVAVYTGADVAGKVHPVPCAWNVPNCDLKIPAHPVLAVDTVRYQGDGVAMVVAESRGVARDALELITAQYEALPAVIDPEQAAQPGAPQLHADVPGNIAFTWTVAGGNTDEAFAAAPVTVDLRLTHQRMQPSAIETRAAVAQYNSGSGELTLWVTSQNPHIHRFICAGMLGVPEHRVRVVAPEVGGAFGSKIAIYADEALACFAAMDTGKPVKWTEDRSENYLTTTHGRDHVAYVELCGTEDGTVTGVRARVYAGLGAYASTAAPGIPTILHGLMYCGPYDIPNITGVIRGVYTTATPVDAYRGAGRPEATYMLERLMDAYARRIGMDPVEVRRKNLVRKEQFPHNTVTGLTYDSGDYHGALDKALGMFDYAGFRREQAAARAAGRYIGVGVTTYNEICGLGPSVIAGATGFGGGLYESAVVRVFPTGTVRAYIGAKPHGQGEETTFAQVLAQEFGIPVENVEIVHGDTEKTPQGWGTYGSRTTAVSGSAMTLAARRVKAKAKTLAAHLLGVDEGAVEWDGTHFVSTADPSQKKSFGDVALMANLAWNMPAGLEPGLEASASFDPPNFVYPFGTHICAVEVDPATGTVKILRYLAVDDCGPLINPMIVEGQVHGGVIQGISEALQEQALYDEQGRLITGTMMDYAVPRAAQMPRIETAHTVTPTTVNPLGVKGIGEAGTIASVPSVVSAVCDALTPFGVHHIQKPLTPSRVWAAIHDATARGAA